MTEKTAYLFKLEIGNYTLGGTHFNIVADTLKDAWKILFEMAIPEWVCAHQTSWNVTFLGAGRLITNRTEEK